MNKNKPNEQKKTSIGGSALIEGVMMRGPETTVMAVRKPDNTIDLVEWKEGAKKPWYKTTPFVRGIFNFIDSMRLSYKCLMRSAEIAGVDEDEPSPFEIKLKKIFGEKFFAVFGGIAMVLGLALAIGLFMVLPTLLIGTLRKFITSRILLSFIEGVTKITIFVIYLYVVSRLSDIKRVFQYHGAEHKTIACYERVRS